MAQKVSKQEAVRRALAHFGNDAKPLQMQPWIKLDDILYVKALVGRLGPDQLHRLIDAFAK